LHSRSITNLKAIHLGRHDPLALEYQIALRAATVLVSARLFVSAETAEGESIKEASQSTENSGLHHTKSPYYAVIATSSAFRNSRDLILLTLIGFFQHDFHAILEVHNESFTAQRSLAAPFLKKINCLSFG
jgi:hypothetical protein